MFWRKPKQGEVARSSKHFFVIPSIFLLSFQVLFFVIPSQSEESTAWMLRCAQHDKGGVIPIALFCHSRTLFCHSERQ